ncbi:MAG: hypothetical protein AAF551_05830 [Bacteroidota bacterium]
MNSVAEIKTGLHHYIAETDDVQILTKLQKYVEKLLSQEDRVIAYTADGQALNRDAYKGDIDSAIKEAESGKVLSIEEMEKDL